MIFFPFVIFRSRRQKSSDEFDSVHLNPPENKYFSYNLEFQEREFSFTRFFVRSTGIQIYIIHPPRVNRKYFSLGLERTNKRFHPFISIINFIITDKRWNSTFPPPEGTRKKLTIYVIRARTCVDSRSSGESTLPEAVMIGIADSRREYRYVGRFNTTIAFLSTILFRVRTRSKRKKCGRRGRKDASLLDTVERGCSSGGGIGAFRECRRLRLMLFTQSPGYRAFLQHDWLLPRHPYGHWSFPAGS